MGRSEKNDGFQGRLILNRMHPDLADIAIGESWQSDHQLYKDERLVDLISCIHSTAKTVLRFLKVGYDVIEITE